MIRRIPPKYSSVVDIRDSSDGLGWSEGVGESDEWCREECRRDSKSDVAEMASDSSIEGRPRSEVSERFREGKRGMPVGRTLDFER